MSAPPNSRFEDIEDERTEISTATARKIEVSRVPPRLELITGPGAPRTFPLQGKELKVGRSDGCDVRIDAQDLSRIHARILLRDGIVEIEDLNSRNGILLNEVKVHSARLSEGDLIQLGDLVFAFHEGAA